MCSAMCSPDDYAASGAIREDSYGEYEIRRAKVCEGREGVAIQFYIDGTKVRYAAIKDAAQSEKQVLEGLLERRSQRLEEAI